MCSPFLFCPHIYTYIFDTVSIQFNFLFFNTLEISWLRIVGGIHVIFKSAHRIQSKKKAQRERERRWYNYLRTHLFDISGRTAHYEFLQT